MSLQVKVIVLSALSPLIVTAIHMVTARMSRTPSRQKVALKSIVIGYVPVYLLLCYLAAGDFHRVSEMLRAGFYCFLVYSCLAYTYFHFFNMSETSRRIKILYEIYSNDRLPLENITVLYKTSDVVHLRFRRLVEMGQLKYDGRLYSLNGRILYIAALAVSAWRSILGFPTHAASEKRGA